MSLKVELKPGEKLIIGESVVTNGEHRARLVIDGEAPILREKDILTAQEADTPCKKIYLVVQLMYLSGAPEKHRELYFQLVEDVVKAAPSTMPYIQAVNVQILAGALYKALKEARNLIAWEAQLLSGVRPQATGTGG